MLYCIIGLYFDRFPQATMAQIANFGLSPLVEGYLTSKKSMEVIFFLYQQKVNIP
jgi:hypothetical protein